MIEYIKDNECKMVMEIYDNMDNSFIRLQHNMFATPRTTSQASPS